MGEQENARILAQLAALGAAPNGFGDFLADPERGAKLLHALQEFDPSKTGFRNEDLFAAAEGLRRLCESLLAHLIEKYRHQERIRNIGPGGRLLTQLRAGPAVDRRSLNRTIGTFYDDWPYAAHWRRDLYRLPAAGLTVFALIFGGMQKLRDLLDEQTGLI